VKVGDILHVISKRIDLNIGAHKRFEKGDCPIVTSEREKTKDASLGGVIDGLSYRIGETAAFSKMRKPLPEHTPLPPEKLGGPLSSMRRGRSRLSTGSCRCAPLKGV